MTWKHRVMPFARPFIRTHARVSRGMTLGVRGIVFDEAGRVLLVRHTYMHGWHFPGGGVERGETAEQAMARELVEEAGVRVEGKPSLLSVHSSHPRFSGDHVLFYRIDRWSACEATSRGEIEAVEWFAPDAPPKGITGGTRRRIEEALGLRDPDPFW